jgi:hypothetical protein
MGADLIGGLDPCALTATRSAIWISFLDWPASIIKIDIHLHERGELGAFSLELILAFIRRYQKQNAVTISHGFCLGMLEPARQQRFAEEMAELGQRRNNRACRYCRAAVGTAR